MCLDIIPLNERCYHYVSSYIDSKDYGTSVTRVPQVILEEIERDIIPTMEEYPFGCRSKQLSDNWKGFYKYKIGMYRLVFRVNLNSKRVQLVWVS